jgi:hypothetical protein
MELVKFAVKVAAVIAVFRLAQDLLPVPASVQKYLP